MTSTAPAAAFADLSSFAVIRILNEQHKEKRAALLCSVKGREGQAIVVLARKPLTSLPDFLSGQTSLTLDFNNDIYYTYEGQPPRELSGLKVDVIYPCTAKHIAKHSSQRYYIVGVFRESPEDYAAVTEPYIRGLPSASIAWVYNILEKKKEADRIVFEDADPDTGFILLPDLKWDQKDTQALYCQALPLRRDLRSLRDLTAAHLPLLRNVLNKASQVILERYGVPQRELRVFLHYVPSYFHLHVHFLHTQSEAGGALVGKAHLLHDVIDTLESFSAAYYQRCTLTCVLGEHDALLERLSAHQERVGGPQASALDAVLPSNEGQEEGQGHKRARVTEPDKAAS